MIRSVSTLPLGASEINLLIENGFATMESLEGIKPLDLSRALGCPHDQALSIWKSVQPTSDITRLSTTSSAKDILTRRDTGRSIISFCRELDSLMAGGVPIGQITEFCGVPGIGKTQLCMQLALDAQIPEIFSGNGAETVYIDTEGSLVISRLALMADALATHIAKLGKARSGSSSSTSGVTSMNPQSSAEILSVAASMTRNRLLEGIHVYRVHDQTELLAVIAQLPSFLKTHTKVRLLVIDSIAFHFRQSIEDNMAKRTRLLSNLAQNLNQIAYESNLAVVLTNHVISNITTTTCPSTSNIASSSSSSAAMIMTPNNNNSNYHSTNNTYEEKIMTTTRMNSNNNVTATTTGGHSLVPALGESWSHAITNRIMLYWSKTTTTTNGSNISSSSDRVAEVVKSPCWSAGRARFAVCSVGIRDTNVLVRELEKKKQAYLQQQLQLQQHQMQQQQNIPTNYSHSAESMTIVSNSATSNNNKHQRIL